MVQCAEYHAPIGPLLLTSDGEALTGLWMDRMTPEHAVSLEALPVFQKAGKWLDAYFRGEDKRIDFPLAPEGTFFQQQVWELLLQIPYGETSTYGTLAREVAKRTGKGKMSAQAVGGAVGRNSISIIIPCHRVIGAQGQLTGYAGGINKKVWLLRHEGWKGEERI